jgi:hypothetical protein
VARYQLFVDDSGTREYDSLRDYVQSGRSLYFVYGGILVQEDHAASSLIPKLRKLKEEAFGDADVEIKSNWLRMPQERKLRYLEPFGLPPERLAEFVDEYYAALNAANIVLIASVVNKLHMQEKYPQPWYPFTAAYEILLQRASLAVSRGDLVSVTVDDIGGKTPKHNEYRTLVKAHHEKLRKHGSTLQRQIAFDCLDGPVRFVLSQHYDLIQAADLIAYNVNRQFRDHGEAWETVPQNGQSLPTYQYFKRIAGKFRHDGQGRIQGYGIAKFPLLRRLKWRVKRKT